MRADHTTPEDRLKHFLSILTHLGWGLAPTMRPQPLGEKRRDDLAGASWIALSLPDGQSLLALAVPGALPGLAECYKRFEDFDAGHRTLVRALRQQNLASSCLLLLGDKGAQLLDLELEDILLDAASTTEINERLLPLLDMQALVLGSLASFPRKHLRQRARELADWTQLWSTIIGGRLEATPGTMARFFEWLHLARVAERNRVGPPPEAMFDEFALAGKPLVSRRFLEDRFRPLNGQWFLLQDTPLKPMLDLVAAAAHDGVLDDCLKSYALLGAGKFGSDVFAEAFADEELRHRSWRASITGELPEELAAAPDGPPRDWTQMRLTVDLDRFGTSGLLRAFDALTERVRATALDNQVALERGERPGMQLDLLGGQPDDILPIEAARHVLKSALAVRTAEPTRSGLARMILLARACEWHRKFDARDVRFARVTVEVAPPPRARESAAFESPLN